MKLIKKILVGTIAVVFAVACNDGIDPISRVEPGPDESAPVVTLKFPLEGTEIKVAELVASIGIDFEVTDDIEVKTIKLSMDGVEFGTLSEFKDYRRVLVEDFMYEGLTNGLHTLTITATDIEGKTTSASAAFEKAPPYVPIYDGEVFYMSFDNEVGFKELVTFSDPTIVGSPGFAGQGSGGNAYAGATDSYLTFPTTGLQGNEFSAVFWMKVNAVPDRAGILVMGPPDPAAPTAPNNRTSGFRFFRENAGGKQRFKLNVGNGTADSWFDGGSAADVAPGTDEWVNFAFTISGTESVVYIDGEVVSQGAFSGISWAACDVLSIMSGAPRFTGWDHKSDLSYMDELRLFDKALSQVEIQTIIEDKYEPLYDGEVFYMSFNGNNKEVISGTPATEVGTPDFAGDGVRGSSYAGAADSYLTFPTEGIANDEFSASFWLKINAVPDRAGILVMGPPDPDLPATPNNRKAGFRFFRENAGGKQRFKLNVGNGTADSWFDGGAAADVDPAANEWVHFAFTISNTECVVYVNGDVVSQGAFAGVSWEGCDILSIMSGDPRFMEWGHHSDESYMDELRIFNKALTQAEVEAVMDGN